MKSASLSRTFLCASLLGLSMLFSSTALSSQVRDSANLIGGIDPPGELEDYGEVASHPEWSDIRGKPATATRWPVWSEVTGKPETALRWPAWSEISSKPETAMRWPRWSEISDKPGAFPAAAHDHDDRYLRLTGGRLHYPGTSPEWGGRDEGTLNVASDSTVAPEIKLHGEGVIAADSTLALISKNGRPLEFRVDGINRSDSRKVFEVNGEGDLSFAGAFQVGSALRIRHGGDFDFLPTHTDERNAERPLYIVGDNYGGLRASVLMERYVKADGKGPGAVKDGNGIIGNRLGGTPEDIGEPPPGQVISLLGRVAHPGANFRPVAAGAIDIFYPEQAGPAREGEIHFRVANDTTGKDVLNRNMILTSRGYLGVGPDGIVPTERLHVGGNVLADSYLKASDRRLKRDIMPMENALENVLSLSGVTYRMDGSPETQRRIGLIAQDVAAVFPEAVRENEEGFLSLDYSVLVAPLVESIRELHAENIRMQDVLLELLEENERKDDFIAGLERRLEALEGKH